MHIRCGIPSVDGMDFGSFVGDDLPGVPKNNGSMVVPSAHQLRFVFPSADGIAFSSGSEGLILQAKLRMRCPRPQTARLALWESSAAGGERESRLPLKRGNGQLFSLPKRKKLAKKKLATLQVDRLRPSIVSQESFLFPRVLCLRWRFHLHPKLRGWKPSAHEMAASI